MPDTRSKTLAIKKMNDRLEALQRLRSELVRKRADIYKEIDALDHEIYTLLPHEPSGDLESTYESDATLYMISPSPSVESESAATM